LLHAAPVFPAFKEIESSLSLFERTATFIHWTTELNHQPNAFLLQWLNRIPAPTTL
jgi:hypothetical protein